MWADWMWSPSHSHSVGENVTAQGDTRTWGLLFDTSEESTWHSTGICGRWSPQRYDTKYSMLNNSSEKRGFVLILNKKKVFQFRLWMFKNILHSYNLLSKMSHFFFFCRYHFHGSSTGKHKGGILYWKTNFGLWSVRLLKMGSWDLQGSLRGIPGVLSKKCILIIIPSISSIFAECVNTLGLDGINTLSGITITSKSKSLITWRPVVLFVSLCFENNSWSLKLASESFFFLFFLIQNRLKKV